MHTLEFSEIADEQYKKLAENRAQERHFKAVRKALRFLAENPRHPSLNTHEWKSEPCPHGDKLWEAYAENQTSGAFRIFFCYPPSAQKVATGTPKPAAPPGRSEPARVICIVGYCCDHTAPIVSATATPRPHDERREVGRGDPDRVQDTEVAQFAAVAEFVDCCRIDSEAIGDLGHAEQLRHVAAAAVDAERWATGRREVG